MKLAIKACIVSVLLLTLAFAVPAQRSDKDDRNTAPTVGTGGPVGGPTGLFTVYDGQTLRRGEYTFSIAYSNYDRDPGNVDITSVPLSFQVGASDHLELFFGTEAWRGVHVNAPRNLSGFYLPNSQVPIGGALRRPPSITLNTAGTAGVFNPVGGPFIQYPFNVTPRPGGVADLFPGVGSPFGSILPGVVLTTTPITGGTAPVLFTIEPSYLPDAPFINRTWGTSSFNSFDFGAKWRMNDKDDAIGFGLIASWRWYLDHGTSFSGFNMMQRGSGPGGKWGDVNLTFFTDARLTKHANLSGNVGYTHTTNPKGTFGGTDFTLLDRPDEFLASIGADFPVNKHLQFIFELRALRYVGGRTPNAFERNPLDALGGLRIFPRRWWGIGAAYRANVNQQSKRSFGDAGVPVGFQVSDNPHGWIGQFWIGRRIPRQGPIVNQPANVESVTLSDTNIVLPCPPGTVSESQCNDSRTVSVTTAAHDPENDVLTYSYTVSGGRIIGTGANVQWDLTTAQPGTYTITTGVDDGCGICGKTNTQTITISECPNCHPQCACPTVSVSGPSGVTAPGQPMTFVATVSGAENATYNWTVSAGTISSGQGTSTITR